MPILLVIRICVCLVYTYSIGRFCAIAATVLTITAHLMIAVVSLMVESGHKIASSVGSGRRCLDYHNQFQIIFQSALDPENTCVAVVMMAGFVLSILFNFVSIKMISIIPMPMYLFFPGTSILILVFAQVSL